MSNMNLKLQLTANDKASPKLKKLSDSIAKSNQRIHQSSAATAAKQQRVVQKTVAVQKKAASARLRLGVRTEKQIQREIKQTQAAYNRLARSGTSSAHELSRAYGRMSDKVSRLNRELGKTSKRQRAMGKMRRGGAMVGGAVAGGMVAGSILATPAKRQMSYDRKLAMVSNTAFSDRDVKGRIEGKAELAAAVKKAVETGGGKKDDALTALDTLLASGSVGTKTAMDLLPTLQKGSVATGASTEDLSKIAISAMQQFGIKSEEIGKALDMAVAAGQAGNFELSDMARWLPQQMAAAKNAGMSGMDGYKALLVANQQARVTAGSSDEAGNNLVNLLAKLTSKETNERFDKLDYVDPTDGKTKGIDYIKSMEKGKREGKDPIQSFMGIIDKVVGNDSRYQALQKQLKTADSGEQKKLIAEMTNLVEGTAVGKIVSDRQALMAMLGIRNNAALGADVSKDIDKSKGAVNTSHQVIADTNDFKTEKASNNFKEAQDKFMGGFNDFLGNLSVKFSTWSEKHPNASTAVAGAGTVAVAGGAVAGGGMVGSRLLGGGAQAATQAAAKQAAAQVATRAAAPAVTATAASRGAGFLGGLSKLLMRANVASLALTPTAVASDEHEGALLAASSERYKAQMASNPAMAQQHQKSSQRWDEQKKLLNQQFKDRQRAEIPSRIAEIMAKVQSHKKQSKALNSDIAMAESSMQYGVAESLKDEQATLNQTIQQLLQQSQQLSSELVAKTAESTSAIKSLAAQPIMVQTTNQIYVDGAQVSESVSKQQANRMDRGQ